MMLTHLFIKKMSLLINLKIDIIMMDYFHNSHFGSRIIKA